MLAFVCLFVLGLLVGGFVVAYRITNGFRLY